MYKFSEIEILLASRSQRRAELLTQAGIRFSVVDQDIPEIVPAEMPVEKAAEYLACLKSAACRDQLAKPNQIMLAADSVVILDDKLLGKPVDASQAVEMLTMLSGKTHKVITGVCLESLRAKRSFAEVAEVRFYEMTDEEIAYYIDTCKPLDKAGAYGIQEWIGLCHVAEIRGNYSNIMGLPVSRLYRELQLMITK